MIGYIKGKVLNVSVGVLLIENNGIGYEVNCSSSVMAKANVNSECEVYTYMAVREDGVYLYGFSSLAEKSMFLKLITVSGVGPKMGITVLSAVGINELALWIATEDVKSLSKIKGLGKKTAERIILELREKITEDASLTGEVTSIVPIKDEGVVNEDAVVALMSLGFTKTESITAVKNATAQGATSVEQLISFALKNIR